MNKTNISKFLWRKMNHGFYCDTYLFCRNNRCLFLEKNRHVYFRCSESRTEE